MFQDALFFLSKLIGPLSDPRTTLFATLAAGILMLWTPWRRIGRALASLTIVSAIALSAAPIGPLAVGWIENRIPPPEQLPQQVDGIVVLGGDVNSRMLRLRPVSPGHDSTRLIAFADLSRHYPNAKLVFSGGSGQVLDRTDTDSDGARRLLPILGVDTTRVIFEDKSRNTFENARFSLDIAQPKPEETWLLVTSAFHMPRSLSTFRQAGWKIVPYPVGYMTAPDAAFEWQFPTSFDGRLFYLAVAARELVGYAYYFVTGRSASLLPGP
ncbi:MAG: YdcF family protein [Alphaproteobacteria bacterium]|nr:YdcF family protein [Alphaproteobacteria bacterium]